MPSNIVALESIDSKLKLEFLQQADRFGSRIVAIQNGLVLIQSVEDSEGDTRKPDANWPPSPPLQEIVAQEMNGQPYLAGIGRAGKSHWSVIIKPLADDHGFDFEFACRVKEPPTWIGSTYATLTRDQSTGANVRCTSSDAKVEVAGDVVRIVPQLDEEPTYPLTIQWRYQLIFG